MSSVAETVRQRATRSVLDARLIVAAYVLFSAVGLLGLSLGSAPLAVDFPNHAARLFVECNPADPLLTRMYSIDYGLIPNLAIDLLNRPLCGLVEPMTFLRGTLALTMLGVLVVVWKLHLLFNEKPNAFVLLAPAMTFNVITGMGYLNYLIGTFLFLLFAWSMLRYDVLQRHRAFAFILPNIFGSLIFLCHIFALGLAGVFLFALRLSKDRERSLADRIMRAGFFTALSFVAPLFMVLLADRSGLGFTYALAGKIRTLWAPLVYSTSNSYVPALLAVFWIALLYWAFREKRISVARSLRWPLALLGAYSLLLPSALLNAVDLDARTFVSLAYLAVASLCLRPPEKGAGASPLAAEIAAAVVAAVTLVLQLATLVSQTSTFGAQVSEFRSALKVIPSGSPVITVADFSRTPVVPHRFYAHLVSYVTIDQKAFNPLEFTGKGMQPMIVQPAFSCIDVSASAPVPLGLFPKLAMPEKVSLTERYGSMNYRYAYHWDRNFDYVIYYHYGTPGNPVPRELRPVHQGSFFTIFRTRRPFSPDGPCTTPRQ